MYGCARGVSASLFIGFIGFTGCVKVPDLKPIANSSDGKSEGSISIDEIVKRVKCEIRDSLVGRDGVAYKWLDKWTISADLSLTVSDNSQISPGVVLTHQFLLGNIPGRITNSAQSSSLGLGGQASTTAALTEIVSFSMSVKEICKEFFFANSSVINPAAAGRPYNFCAPYGDLPMDLTGKLGLKQWVDSAFGPVTDSVGNRALLIEGDHKQPKPPSAGGGGGAGGATIQAVHSLAAGAPDRGPTPEELPGNLKAELELLYSQLGRLRAVEDGIDAAAATVTRLGAIKQAGAISEQDALALTKAQATLKDVVIQQRETLADVNRLLKKVITSKCSCDDVINYLKRKQAALIAAIPAKPAPSLDPPIDAISHQVQFTIAYNASANPTWTMLNFKGPSPTSGNFFSAMDTNIHTLTIVMGEPSSPAASNARSALTLSNQFQTTLAPLLIPGTAPIF